MKDEKSETQKLQSLSERSRNFAMRIIELYSTLPSRPLEQCIGRQLLRPGTSVGAQLREGKRGRSVAEVISKTESALQELEESVYWMELLRDTQLISSERLMGAFREADELTAILVAGVKSLKARKYAN